MKKGTKEVSKTLERILCQISMWFHLNLGPYC